MAIRLFLSGCCGRMGRTIRSLVAETTDLQIVAGSDLLPDPECPFPVWQNPADCHETFDVLIDFSNPAALPALCDLIAERRCPAIICTTGIPEDIRARILALSQMAPVFMSANMSLGINVLVQLARRAASLLYPEFDVEIIEAHHNQKVDAPSGTALLIADAINDALAGQLHYVNDRSQTRQKRQPGELGLHAIRGGSIVGEHTVLLAGPEETIEIRHSAQSRHVFARGALAAARYMTGKQPGLYNMADLVDGR